LSIDTQIPVRTVGLAKSFGPVHALRDVTLDLESGSVLALLGENGMSTQITALVHASRQGRSSTGWASMPPSVITWMSTLPHLRAGTHAAIRARHGSTCAQHVVARPASAALGRRWRLACARERERL
jgi:ABC-type glutathione transport system ATPase component